jgi:hypothetical protein
VTSDTDPAPVLPAFGGAAEDAPPRDRRGVLAGRLARVGFVEAGPIGPVALAAQEVVPRIAAPGDVASIRQTATGLERRIRSGAATLHERVFVPLDAPFVLLEWRASGADASVVLERVGPDCAVHAWPAVALAGTVSGAAPQASVVRIPAGEAAVVAVALPGIDRREIARRAPALVRARSAAAGRAEAEGMSLDAGVPELAAAWARAREALLAATDPPSPDGHRARLVLGLRDDPPLRGDALAGDAATVADMAAATLAWTGDTGSIREAWPRIRPLLVDPAGPPGHDRLVALAEAIGDAGAVAALRSRRPATLRAGTGAAAGRARPGRSFLPPGAAVASPAAAAGLVLDIADRLLGLAPDAPRNRLVLAPRIPPAWPGVSADRIRMAESSVSLHHTSSGGMHRFDISQAAGAVPVLLVLQPTVPAGSWRFEVDGAAAELDARPVEGGIAFAVQLALDQPRRVAALPAG